MIRPVMHIAHKQTLYIDNSRDSSQQLAATLKSSITTDVCHALTEVAGTIGTIEIMGPSVNGPDQIPNITLLGHLTVESTLPVHLFDVSQPQPDSNHP